MNLVGRSLLVDKVAFHFEGKPFTQAIFVVYELWQVSSKFKTLVTANFEQVQNSFNNYLWLNNSHLSLISKDRCTKNPSD